MSQRRRERSVDVRLRRVVLGEADVLSDVAVLCDELWVHQGQDLLFMYQVARALS